MKTIRLALLSDLLKRYCLSVLLLFGTPLLLQAQHTAPLKLIQSISLPGLKEGDFDHFAVDLDGHRLFLTAEASGLVEVFRYAVLGGLTTCVLALSFLYYSHSLRSKAGQPTVIPAVTNVGEKYNPSLSPDGQHLAFAWNGGAGPYFSIYVKVLGTEESLRLTKQPSIDFNPVWSPDGRQIA